MKADELIHVFSHGRYSYYVKYSNNNKRKLYYYRVENMAPYHFNKKTYRINKEKFLENLLLYLEKYNEQKRFLKQKVINLEYDK